MNGQDLKNSILQLAIQGKLVEQREEEGTATEFLEQIVAEKKRLIKEGKIKKTKTLPEITEDEIPFDIPESWEWVRLADVSQNIHYGYTASAKGVGNCKLLRITDIQNNSVDWGSVPFCDVTDKDFLTYGLNNRDIMIARTGGTIGKTYIVESLKDRAVFASYLIRVVPLESIDEYYLKRFMESPLYWLQLKAGSMGTGQPNVNATTLSRLILPFPPLEEQKRIIAKIEELMTYVGKYDKAYSEVEELNKKFPEDMRKSILQYAIQGKLVEQREEEGTAEELYQKIQEEKEKLIEAGKINKQKLLAEISEDELPFEIPESWKWVRLEDISEYIQRGKSPKYSEIKQYPVVAQKCIQWSGFSLDKAKFIDPKTITSYKEERFLVDGDLMWNSTGLGTLGRIAIYEKCKNRYELAVADSHVTVIRPIKTHLSCKYFYYYFSSPSVQNVIEEQSDGSTKQKELSTTTVKNYIVPLPPLEEQKRIVAKIEELLPYTKQLVKE
ncbi:restriction endonuclease subunit S [Neobacillus niacini]|uniref:restriction endonuclease subunit S n=1 Tax=Neobacillus niacini TaxID=86668 RepID=UPI003B02C84D